MDKPNQLENHHSIHQFFCPSMLFPVAPFLLHKDFYLFSIPFLNLL